MGIIEETWMRLVGTGVFDYNIVSGDILLVLTVIATSLLVRFLWVVLQDFRIFNIWLFFAYTLLACTTLLFAWPRISTMLGSFAGIVILIVMYWGARTWTAR